MNWFGVLHPSDIFNAVGQATYAQFIKRPKKDKRDDCTADYSHVWYISNFLGILKEFVSTSGKPGQLSFFQCSQE